MSARLAAATVSKHDRVSTFLLSEVFRLDGKKSRRSGFVVVVVVFRRTSKTPHALGINTKVFVHIVERELSLEIRRKIGKSWAGVTHVLHC